MSLSSVPPPPPPNIPSEITTLSGKCLVTRCKNAKAAGAFFCSVNCFTSYFQNTHMQPPATPPNPNQRSQPSRRLHQEAMLLPYQCTWVTNRDIAGNKCVCGMRFKNIPSLDAHKAQSNHQRRRPTKYSSYQTQQQNMHQYETSFLNSNVKEQLLNSSFVQERSPVEPKHQDLTNFQVMQQSVLPNYQHQNTATALVSQPSSVLFSKPSAVSYENGSDRMNYNPTTHLASPINMLVRNSSTNFLANSIGPLAVSPSQNTGLNPTNVSYLSNTSLHRRSLQSAELLHIDPPESTGVDDPHDANPLKLCVIPLPDVDFPPHPHHLQQRHSADLHTESCVTGCEAAPAHGSCRTESVSGIDPESSLVLEPDVSRIQTDATGDHINTEVPVVGIVKLSDSCDLPVIAIDDDKCEQPTSKRRRM